MCNPLATAEPRVWRVDRHTFLTRRGRRAAGASDTDDRVVEVERRLRRAETKASKLEDRLDDVRQARVAVVSYPKSGRTWHRAMVGLYLTRRFDLDDRDALDVDALTRGLPVPILNYSHDGANFAGDDGKRASADPGVAAGRHHGRPAIYLVRDVREILVSGWHWGRGRAGVPEVPISEFIRDDRTGLLKILTAYRRWHDGLDQHRGVDVIHYDDLVADPADGLRRALAFLHLEPDPVLVDEVVEACRADNLREMERAGFFRNPALSNQSGDDPSTFKVRRAEPGSWADDLSSGDVAWIDDMEARIGNPFARPPLPPAGGTSCGMGR